jgi:hypothetical protein
MWQLRISRPHSGNCGSADRSHGNCGAADHL